MFKIITPVYNSERWIDKCIKSVLSQDFDRWEMVIINDGSTDGTLNIINRNRDDRIKLINNKKRIGSSLENILKGINYIAKDDEDIIIILDGDDWLYSSDVLSYLKNIYSNNNILITYGQFEPVSKKYKNHCRQIKKTKNHRKKIKNWRYSHLRTFKKKLWDRIDYKDLRDKNGEYYKVANDVVTMLPMLEMAGLKRIKFIKKILYVYNDLNELNEMKIYKEESPRVFHEILEKPEYEEIKDF